MSDKWTTPASEEVLADTIKNLNGHNFAVTLVNTKEEALAKIKEILPETAQVSTASSTTLNEIGFSDYLQSGSHQYDNLSAKTWAEEDNDKRNNLRRQSLTADYVLGSVNAITEDGKLVAVDNTGSRVSAYAFAAKNLILVASTNKIVKNVDEAMTRIKEYIFPLEDARMQQAYGIGSGYGKWMIMENEVNPERIKLILVKEKLGF